MGLTYDGITYRSLEEQVRYDAEQVQILKQADVTINESLQTVNTELNGKLTKPANPSAESAVTMLADGTVGTKPLSEIGGSGGGGGGKLYMHITDTTNSEPYFRFITYSTKQTSYTNDEVIQILTGKQFPCYYSNTEGKGMGYIEYFVGPGFIFRCVLVGNSGGTKVIDQTMETVSIRDGTIEV